MGTSKKPRKAYCRGKVLKGGNLPLTRDKALQIEARALMSISALVGGFMNTAMATDFALFVAACSYLPEDDELPPLVLPATRVLCSVHDRFTKTKRWGVSGDELVVLKEVIPKLVARYNSCNRGVALNAMLKAHNRFFVAADARLKDIGQTEKIC